MEKLRNQGDVYTFESFEGPSDAKNIELDQISFFPDSEQIFQNTLSGELMPFFSFNLNLIYQDLNGTASFVHVYREYGEYSSDKWYNEYCTDYLLTFEQVGTVQLKLLEKRNCLVALNLIKNIKNDPEKITIKQK